MQSLTSQNPCDSVLCHASETLKSHNSFRTCTKAHNLVLETETIAWCALKSCARGSSRGWPSPWVASTLGIFSGIPYPRCLRWCLSFLPLVPHPFRFPSQSDGYVGRQPLASAMWWSSNSPMTNIHIITSLRRRHWQWLWWSTSYRSLRLNNFSSLSINATSCIVF